MKNIYTWGQVNKALVDRGLSPKVISNILSSLHKAKEEDIEKLSLVKKIVLLNLEEGEKDKEYPKLLENAIEYYSDGYSLNDLDEIYEDLKTK